MHSAAGLDDLIRQTIDSRTKPPGSLGRLEALAAQIAALQHTTSPRMNRCTLTIFAADHGIASAGVSAFPQAVTAQMVQNFLAGGAAANVFARVVGVELQVVDAGVAGPPISHPLLLDRRMGPGTSSFLHDPAMTDAQVARALVAGARIARDSPGEALAFGEMGIGNTASAAVLAHKLTGLPLERLVGRGTGLDDAGLKRKLAVLEYACARTPGHLPADHAMAEYGGFEIVMMAGAMRETAEAGRLVLVDGFIATVAAMLALALASEIRDALVFAHRSSEAGHGVLLDWLNARPLLDLEMRLGEGTGALLVWPLVQAAARMMTDMASFAEAGVADGST